jgi:hypothetical protein
MALMPRICPLDHERAQEQERDKRFHLVLFLGLDGTWTT